MLRSENKICQAVKMDLKRAELFLRAECDGQVQFFERELYLRQLLLNAYETHRQINLVENIIPAGE